jgi:hypothetical protein
VIEYLLGPGGRERKNGTRMMATEAAGRPLEVGA